jgi:hypothetical protein
MTTRRLNLNSLGVSGKKKIKEQSGVKTVSKLINLAREQGVIMIDSKDQRSKETNSTRAYQYFGEIYNQMAKEQAFQYKEKIKKVNSAIKKNKDFSYNFNNTKQLLKVIGLAIKSKKKYTYDIGGKSFTLSINSFNAFYDLYNGKTENVSGSDADIYEDLILSNKINFKYFPDEHKGHKKRVGGFFPFTNNFDYDLTRYQIMKEFTVYGVENNCFMQALINSGIVPDSIESIGIMVCGRDIPQRSLKTIAETFDIKIVVKNTDLDHTTIYNKDGKNILNIGLIDDHYFLNEKTNITRYAVENYADIKFVKEWNRIYRDKNKRCYDRFISSYELILLLKELGYFKPLELDEEIMCSIYSDKITKINKLVEASDLNTKVNRYSDKSLNDKNFVNLFFDFETTTVGAKRDCKKKQDEGETHTPYMCCIKNHEINKTFHGSNCGEEMIKYVAGKYKQVRLIAHNAGYDFRFIYQHLCSISLIDRGKMLLRGKALYYHYGKKVEFIIQDSFAMIATPLRNFGKMFNLPIEKDYMPYHLYTKENVNKRYLEISQVVSGGSSTDDDMSKFIENCKKWNCYAETDGCVDLIKYSQIYCEMDCKVLEGGYNSFHKSTLDVFGIDVNNYMSAGGIAEAYMQKNNVYSNFTKLGGIPRAFIQQCMVGGRTMISKNIKKHIKKNVSDFDAVSLYPSAMKRIGEIGGYLIGSPKILKNFSYDFLKSVDGYFIEIKITKVGKYLDFPLMSKLGEVREFTNDMVGDIIHVDRFALEDLIEFQKIDFDIIKGYYYDEGRDDTILHVIQHLFDERLRQKNLKNPIQEVYKLIMNSSYGKCLQKPFDTKTIYTNRSNHANAVSKNYKSIKSITQLFNDTKDYKGVINENYKIDLFKEIINDYNNCAIGIEILSMSKRIMNEVMCLAQDSGYNIYYQDTDSMHIDDCSVLPLADKFRLKYGRELIGKQMGQFHTDFSSEILKGTLISKESIYLGKKSYVDVLTDETGEIDYHVRMKGINRQSIDFYCKNNNITILDLYKQLYNGKKITFDLACNGAKCCFQFNNDMTIQSLLKFEREVHF